MNISEIDKKTVFAGPVKVVYDPLKIRDLCLHPYYKHALGCPNFGKKAGCPPGSGLFLEHFDDAVYVAGIRFNFVSYVAAKKAEHPDWTERALRNPRHWQGHVRSLLDKYCRQLKTDKPDLVVLRNPEAMGVNLTETCKNAGIFLEWPPVNYVYQLALLARVKARP